MKGIFQYPLILRPKCCDDGPDMGKIKWLTVMKDVMEMGIPLDAADRFIADVMAAAESSCVAPTMDDVKKELNDYSCTPKSNQRLFLCSRCKRGSTFLNVFCQDCLKENHLVWLIKGCSCPTCLANTNAYSENDLRGRIEECKAAVCTHYRHTAAYREVYYHSMITIAGNMAKTGLLNRLSNTTYDEMVITAKLCKDEKVMSNILASNSLSVLKWLGVPIIQYLESCANVVYADTNEGTNCLDHCLKECASHGSIERLLFSFSGDHRLNSDEQKVLKQRYAFHTSKMNKSTNQVGEITVQAATGEGQPIGEGQPTGEEQPIGEGQPTGESQPKKRKKRAPAPSAPCRKSGRERRPNPNRGYDISLDKQAKETPQAKRRKKCQNSPKNTNSHSSIPQPDYSERDISLLLEYLNKSKKKAQDKDAKEEKTEEDIRHDELLTRLGCKKGEEVLAATVISLWLQWRAISEEIRSVELYKALLEEYLARLPESDRSKAASIASNSKRKVVALLIAMGDSAGGNSDTRNQKDQTPDSNNGGNQNSDSINNTYKVKPSEYHRILWRHPGVRKEIIEHVLLLDLYVDGIESYAVSKTNPSLFVVNAMINNAPSSERNTKRMSHFLAVVHEAEDVMPVMKCILKDLTLTGKNGIYVIINKQWHHIRWGVTGIHGDTVAQEDMAGMKNKKFTILPCMYNESCQSIVLSPCEGICVPQSIRAPTSSNEMKMNPRTVDRFPVDSPYRYLTSCYYNVLPEMGNDSSCTERERTANCLKEFFTLFKQKLPCWIPPAIPMESLLSWRDGRIAKTLQSPLFKSLVHEKNGQSNLDAVLKSVTAAFSSDRPIKTCNFDIGMNEYLKVPSNSRYPIDPMHHIPNVGSRILDAISGGYSVKDVEFELFLKRNIDKAMSLKDLLIPPEVGYLAAERVYQLQKPWRTKKKGGADKDDECPCERAGFLNRFNLDQFSTENQTAPPSWLKPRLVTSAGFNKTRNHDDIVFLLCYFGWVFQDSMHIPFIFASKQVFDCLGYLYNHVNEYQKAKSVQIILDFFLEFMRSVMPPTFATISLHNATHYLDTIRCFGPLKNHDCFGNERLLQYAKFNAISSPNPGVTVQRRMIQLEDASVLANGRDCRLKSLRVPSSGVACSYPDLLDITKCNLTDDKAFFLDDSMPFPTYVDSQLQLGTRNHLILDIFDIDIEHATRYDTVTFRGKKCYSKTLPETIDTKWLAENSKSIGFLKTIDGEIAMFVVTGYIVVKVNKSLYAQAICKYLKTRSTSSFLSSQHGRICYQSYQSSEMKEVLVSLYQLHMNEAVSLYYKRANVCEYALNSINIRQSNPITEDTIFNRDNVRRYNTRQNQFKE